MWRIITGLPDVLACNPVAKWLTGSARLSWRPVLGLALAAAVLNLALDTVLMGSDISGSLFLSYLAVNLLVALLGLVSLARLTAGLMRDVVGADALDLLLLTPLTDDELVQGLLGVAVYRLRWVLAVLLGFMAAFGLWVLVPMMIYGPVNWDTLLLVSMMLVLALGACQTALLAVVVGVRVAVRWRGQPIAVVMALLNMLLLMIMLPSALLVGFCLLTFFTFTIDTVEAILIIHLIALVLLGLSHRLGQWQGWLTARRLRR